MEDSYAADYLSNLSAILSIARELEDLLEASLPAPLSRRGSEGALRIDPEITLPVSILGDSESGSRDRSTAIQVEAKKNIQQSMSVIMTSELEG